MIYTNKLNLPEVFLNVLQNNDYSRGDADISVSSLLLPPRIFQLTERHKDGIVSDVIDNIWRIFGTAIHNLLEKNAPQNTLTEERLKVKIGGWVISGKFDLYDGGLDDYKVTSGWSIVFGSRIEEWKWLLNFYRLLALDAHLEVNRLRNILIIRDWSAYQAKQNPDFPQEQVHIINQPIEEYEQTIGRIYVRVKIHQDASKLSDADLPICTPEERWANEKKYALRKQGKKRALKLFDTEQEAEHYLKTEILDNGTFAIEERLGESKRCEKYCEANQFCNYYKEVLCQK